MPELNEVLQRMRKTREEKKKIKEMFKESLDQSKTYQETREQLETLKAKKVQIETEVRGEFLKEMEQMDRLTTDLKSDAELLSDLALTKFMKGESIEVTDENDVKYEPVFKVTFKKAL